MTVSNAPQSQQREAGRSDPRMIALGGALGLASVLPPALAVRHSSQAGARLATGGLLIAAAIYPAARRAVSMNSATIREMAGLAAAGALTVQATRLGGRRGRKLLGAGWALHALFDASHDAGPDSRIPPWYPAACAAFDLVFAGALIWPTQDAQAANLVQR